MARKFLYIIAALAVLVIAGLFVLRIWSGDLTRLAFVPKGAFAPQAALAENAYADPAMWISRPDKANDPARWRPEGAVAPAAGEPKYAVFFVHPTSYLEKAQWNAPLDDASANSRARLFVRGLASPFAGASEIWAPRYRQAAFGAALTTAPEAQKAVDAAYRDVAQAFDYFLAQVPADMPIVLAGHSQGAVHVLRLLHERVAGKPLQQRIAAAYPVGWPVSLEHDLPALGLPACKSGGQAGCIVTWISFAEPADPGEWLEVYRASAGFDGKPRGDSPILCVNPLTGVEGGSAPATANIGTLVPNVELNNGTLMIRAVPARCDKQGLLLIGDPPKMGPYVLPGNNYHVYDVPLFWANLQQDVARRMSTWAKVH